MPYWSLSLKDGRSIKIGGVRGAGVGGASQETWLQAMRRLSRYPVTPGDVDTRCVNAVVARFEPEDRPFVRSLFAVPTQPVRDIYLCPPDYRSTSAPSGEGCLVVPVAPGSPQVRPAD